MVERASTTVSSTTSSAWAPGHAWSQYCSPSAGSTLAALMPSALHRGPLRISPVKSEPYDMAADIPPSISKSKMQFLITYIISAIPIRAHLFNICTRPSYKYTNLYIIIYVVTFNSMHVILYAVCCVIYILTLGTKKLYFNV